MRPGISDKTQHTQFIEIAMLAGNNLMLRHGAVMETAMDLCCLQAHLSVNCRT